MIMDFLGVKVASDSSDFRSNAENQTDDIEERSAWTQNPALPSAMDSEHVQAAPFAGIKDVSKTLNRKPLDVPGLMDFLKKASALLDDLMSEEVHEEKVSHSVEMGSDRVIVVEEQFQHDFLFSDCRIENAVAVSEGLDASLFLLCHSILLDCAGPFTNSTSRGFVSGWRPNNVSLPQFLVPAFEVPTCAFALCIMKETVIVVGHRDGSLSCQNLQRLRRPATKGDVHANGTQEPIAEVSHVGAKDQEVPSFYSCAAMDENHKESVADIKVLPKRDSGISSSPPEVVSVDKSGAVIVWNVIRKSATGTSDFHIGATPNCRLILVRIRRLASKSIPGMACGLFADHTNDSCFVLAYDSGQLVRFHREGLQVSQNSPDISSPGCVMSSECFAFSLPQPDLYLIGLNDGTVNLYDRKKKHPVSTWSLSSKKAVVSVKWSDVDPATITTVDCEGNIIIWTLNGTETPRGSSSSPKSLHKNAGDKTNTLVRATQCGSYALVYGEERAPALMLTLNDRLLGKR
ncbi:hypothetical protein RvY_12998-2 [Ramazzottius varieornatus]|uniref:Uncharacterized protein n=1 Tax=Ramazzottius varieornatus TaxID=947166 RepID=A0A1D1VLD5_RAMVA|nr:hypothetical protein RvY_12998-2 [Ramazzottius varieornatus]